MISGRSGSERSHVNKESNSLKMQCTASLRGGQSEYSDRCRKWREKCVCVHECAHEYTQECNHPARDTQRTRKISQSNFDYKVYKLLNLNEKTQKNRQQIFYLIFNNILLNTGNDGA